MRDRPVEENSAWEHTTLTTDSHATGGIRTHILSRRTAADLSLRLCGHWDRHPKLFSCLFKFKLLLILRFEWKPLWVDFKYLKKWNCANFEAELSLSLPCLWNFHLNRTILTTTTQEWLFAPLCLWVFVSSTAHALLACVVLSDCPVYCGAVARIVGKCRVNDLWRINAP